MTAPLLRVEGITKRFGGLTAVAGVSFELAEGAVLGIIGPNGSGKTTLLNLLNGVYEPDAGNVWLRGKSILGCPPHRLVRLGVARTFQTPRVFHTVTVSQNMVVPMLHSPVPFGELRAKAMALLELVGLDRFHDLPASELSGGQQKLLEFARALMSDPVLVLMDEPFAGVHPEVRAVLLGRLGEMRERSQASLIVVSHEIPELMALSDRMLCMAEGRVIAAGSPAEVADDPRVVEAYLGRAASVR